MAVFDKRTQNYLTDKDIEDLVSNGKLFSKETFSPTQLSGCAYDLRASKYLTSRNREISLELGSDGYIIQPGEVVTIQTQEFIDLSDPLLLGLIVNSHTQLSRGLFHPITTIDPGFKGSLAITLINQGNTGYRLRNSERIAKVLFCPVSPAPNRIYGTQYRPRVLEGSLEHSLYSEKPSLEKIPDSRLADYFGGPLAELVERVEALEKDAGQYRAEQHLARYRLLGRAGWGIAAGITGGLLVKYSPIVWAAIKRLFH